MLQAFELAQVLFEAHFEDVLLHSFGDFTSCLAAFAQSRAQRVSLQAIGVLRSVFPALQRLVKAEGGEAVERLAGPSGQTVYWYAVLGAFYEVAMKGADLEVRRVALDSLFDIISKHGQGFTPEFWDKVVHGIVFTFFGVLQGQNLPSQEDTTVWLSTTMVQALRNLVELWTAYFDTLQPFFSELLELLETCVCQENDTIARIGTSSLQQLLQNNLAHFDEAQWEQITDTIMRLFSATTASQLFDPMLIASSSSAAPVTPLAEEEEDSSLPRRLEVEGSSALKRPLTSSERRKVFKQIIMRCVLQLLLIETVNDLLQDAEFYERIPPAHLLRLLRALQDSYSFAKQFNGDKDLRVTLWRLGFMRQLPNLLRQESTAASTLVSLLLHMLRDDRPSHVASRTEVLARFIPLGEDIARNFLSLDVETQSRNLSAWMPVVAEIFQGVAGLQDLEETPANDDETHMPANTFSHYAPRFFPSAVDLVVKPGLSAEVLLSLRSFFYKAGLTSGLCPPAPEPPEPATPAGAADEGPAPLSPVLETREPSPSPRRQLSTAMNSRESASPRTAEVTLGGEVAEPPEPLAATTPAFTNELDRLDQHAPSAAPENEYETAVAPDADAHTVTITAAGGEPPITLDEPAQEARIEDQAHSHVSGDETAPTEASEAQPEQALQPRDEDHSQSYPDAHEKGQTSAEEAAHGDEVSESAALTDDAAEKRAHRESEDQEELEELDL